MPSELRTDGHRRVGEILDGKEWTGLVPFRMPGDNAVHGLAEIYVMPSETESGERAALCIVVDVRALRRIETDLAASQAIFGQSPFGFVLFGTDFTVVASQPALRHRLRRPGRRPPRPHGRRLSRPPRGRAADRHPQAGPGDRRLRHRPPARRHRTRRRGDAATGRSTSTACTAEQAGPSASPVSATDVTRRHIAAREAASARRNLALLNEASARIGNSLDLETTARELLDVAVPGFCDLASVDLYQGLLTGDEAPPGSWGSLRQEPVGGSAELRRVGFASAVSDAVPDSTATDGDTDPPAWAPSTATPSTPPAPRPCAPAGSRTSPETTAASSSPPSPCRWSPTTPSSASSSSPVRRAANPSASATVPSPPNWPPAPPSVSTTPASTGANTNAH